MSNSRHESLRKFADGVAHELSNFMNALSLGRQLLDQQIDNPDAARSLENLSGLGGQMDELKDRLERLSLPEPDRRQPADLTDLLPRVVTSLNQELDGSLPEPAIRTEPSLAARVDQPALRYLLEELVENALREAPADSIEINLSADGDHAVITVTDGGFGIPKSPDFDPVAPFATGNDERLGLGLTIADQIARGHGGKLRVSSDDTGTTVTLWLPRTKFSEETDATG